MDRNEGIYEIRNALAVALRKESVDRNLVAWAVARVC